MCRGKRSREERARVGKVGKYLPNNDPSTTLLGDAQWMWLERQLRKPAEIRFVCSSTQIIPDKKGMDEWGCFPHERERLFELVETTKANGVVLLSGNVHFAEISKLETNGYVQGGFGDANGQPTLAGFDTFFDDAEYFSYFEVGATTSQDRIYLDNVHVTLWHVDPREVAATPDGCGAAFTAQKFVDDKWLPFFRCGYSDGDAALMQTTFSTGVGFQRENRDVAGIGLSWGSPADGSLHDQFTSEAFYRFQLTQFLAVTPDVVRRPQQIPSSSCCKRSQTRNP